jgi:hypothetical protein
MKNCSCLQSYEKFINYKHGLMFFSFFISNFSRLTEKPSTYLLTLFTPGVNPCALGQKGCL